MELTVSCRRDTTVDQCLVFSLDFPVDSLKNSYRIEHHLAGFNLKDVKRMCGKDSALALAVSCHGPRDIVAVLNRDGNLKPT
jgi:hypothetical protein